MVKIYSPEELGKFNDYMLQRGMPHKKDGIGYNKIDYPIGSNITGIPSKEECCSLSRILVKYCKTQLDIPDENMKATQEHYKKYKKGYYVSVEGYDSVGIWCTWGYNPDIVTIIRQQPRTNVKWSKEGDIWKCRLTYNAIPHIAAKFKDKGVYVEDLLQALNNKPEKIEDSSEPITVDNKVYKLLVSRKDSDNLNIKVDYNKEIVDLIKSVPTAFFHKKTKSWWIDILQANKLYTQLEKAQNKVDLTELKPWAERVKFDSKYTLTTDLSYVPFTPREYQIEDAKVMLEKKSVINANEMGTGKTFECIIAGESLPFPKLVICPATLRLNWKKEIKMVNPDADIKILYNDSDFETGKDWTIIGYPSLTKHLDNLENQFFNCIIADEAHYIKAINNSGNPSSQRAEAVLRLSKTAEYVFPVTGTPKPNRNKDLFNLLKMVRHPMTQGKWAFMNYGKLYCGGHKNSWGWDFNNSTNDNMLYDNINEFMIRRLKSEVLPDIKKLRMSIPVEVDLREYHKMIDEYLKSRESTEAEQLARLTKARHILATKKANNTIDFTKDLIEQNKKVVIVTCFTDVVKKVEKAFKDNVVKIVGGMNDTAKNKAITEFQEGNAQVCVMNIMAGGVGVTLTASHNIIINDFDWTIGNIIQAEDRCARQGQTEITNVYYMYAEGADMDEVMVETLTSRSESINEAVDGGLGESVDLKDIVKYRLLGTHIEPVIPQSNPTSKKSNTLDTTDTTIKVTSLKELSYEELIEYAKSLKVSWKECENKGINRMRATMELKKVLN